MVGNKFVFLLGLDEALTAMKALMKQAMVESLADNDADVDRGLLLDQLKYLTFVAWTCLMQHCMNQLIALLNRIRAIHDIMSNVVKMETSSPDEVSGFLLLFYFHFQKIVKFHTCFKTKHRS